MKAWVFALGFGVAFLPTIASAGATADVRDCQTGNARHGECITSSTPPAAPRATIAHQVTRMPPPPAQTAHNDAARRRSGKHVPDAELIGPRGAL
ncbi:MAG: hypothetical protein WAU68_04295 [Vitreimonas sp.]